MGTVPQAARFVLRVAVFFGILLRAAVKPTQRDARHLAASCGTACDVNDRHLHGDGVEKNRKNARPAPVP